MSEAEKDLKKVINELEKKYGEGVVLTDGDSHNVKALSTGCFAIDSLLGCGGLPVGRLMEVYGEESSGKSSACLFFAGQIQKQGGKILYIDVEQTYDQKYAAKLGVDTGPNHFYVSQPSTLEETMDILRSFILTNHFDLIIVDSVAAMVPKADFEDGALEKDSVAVKARLMSKYLPVLASEVAASKTVVIFINQTRANIGVYYGPKDTTPGGKSLKFFCSVRLSVTKGTAIKRGDEQVGNSLRIVAKKNKVGIPYREGTMDLYFGEGVDLISDTLDFGVKMGVIALAGNTYSYGETKLGVGKEKVKEALRSDEAMLAKIREEIYSKIKS